MNKNKSHIFTLVTITCIAGGVGLCPISAIAKSENKIVAIKKENTSNLKRVDLTAILESIKPISMVINCIRIIQPCSLQKVKAHKKKVKKKSYQSRI